MHQTDVKHICFLGGGGAGRGGEDGKGGHLKAEGDRAQVAVGSAPAPSFKFGFKWRLHDLNSSFKAPVKFKNKFKPPVKFKCKFDPSKIDTTNGVKITAKIKQGLTSIVEIGKATTNDDDKNTTSDELKVLA